MTPKKTTRIPGEQKFWAVIHWFAVLQTLYLIFVAFRGDAAPTNKLVLVVATIATVIVAVYATVLSRRRLTTQLFVKWTTTGRVVAVGWSFIGILLVVVAFLSALWEFDVVDVDWTAGFIGAVGSVSFLAAVGPGYSDFREALAHKDEPLAA